MTKYMTIEEGKAKARQMMAEAKAEVLAHFGEWKEQTPAYINAYKKLEEAKRLCSSFGVRY